MRFQQVEIDEEVFQFVKRHAEPLVDTFNSALRRLLPLDGKVQKHTSPIKRSPRSSYRHKNSWNIACFPWRNPSGSTADP